MLVAASILSGCTGVRVVERPDGKHEELSTSPAERRMRDALGADSFIIKFDEFGNAVAEWTLPDGMDRAGLLGQVTTVLDDAKTWDVPVDGGVKLEVRSSERVTLLYGTWLKKDIDKAEWTTEDVLEAGSGVMVVTEFSDGEGTGGIVDD
jgi:hypothetical protein